MLMLERARPDREVLVEAPLVDVPLVDVPLVDGVVLDAPLDMLPLVLPLVLLLGIVVLLPDVLPLVALVSRVVLELPFDSPDELPLTPVVVELLPLEFVRFRSTSPVDVPVVPVVPVVPLRCTVPLAGMQFVVLAPFDVAVLVPVPVPFAPLVVFRPV
jgi:hypothetical protein